MEQVAKTLDQFDLGDGAVQLPIFHANIANFALLLKISPFHQGGVKNF